MAVRDDRSDVKQTTTGFRGPLMVQSLTSAKSKFLSLSLLADPVRTRSFGAHNRRLAQQHYTARAHGCAVLDLLDQVAAEALVG